MSRKDNNFRSDEENDDSSENSENETSEEEKQDSKKKESSDSSEHSEKKERGIERPLREKPIPEEGKKQGRSGKHVPHFILFAGVFLVGIIIGAIASPSFTGNVSSAGSGTDIGAVAAEAKAVDYILSRLEQSYPGIEVVSEGVKESADVPGTYEIMVKMTFQGQPQSAPYYVTKDGKWMFGGGLIDLDEPLPEPAAPAQPASTGVPKSDKPVVELFIWSYCPYGVQAQGPLSDVVALLGENADFQAVLYHDGHGAYETQQNKIQACIQEVAGDKYWEYAAGFVENIYPKCGPTRDIECDKTESANLMKTLSIDDSEVMSCVDERGEELLAEHISRAREYGVTGSPSLIINGVRVNVARNSEAFKSAVCDAFNDAPEECGETLSSSASATSGNC